MDWKATLLPTLLQGSSMLVPLLWSQFGPLVIRFLTGIANTFKNQYIPREWQVVLSGLLGAVLSGLSSADSMETAAVAGAGGLVAGAVSQLYTMADPKTWRTSEQ